jgi:glycosyltransferase 2 family protein
LDLKANKVLLIVLKLSISSSLLYLVFSRTGLDKVIDILKKMSIPAFIFSVLLYMFAQYVSTLRWKLLLPEVLGTRKLFSLYMIGSFFNIFLPGVIGGDAVKGYYLYQATGNATLSFASIFMDRYIGFVALISVCAVAFPFGFLYFAGSRLEWLLPLIVVSFIAASLLIFGLRIGQRVRFISEFYTYFHAYRNQKGVIGNTYMLSVLVQFAGIFAVYLLALGLGQHIPFLAFLIFLPIIILFTTIPISISGLGVRESATVVLFGLVGIRPEVATAISLSWFISMSAGSLMGLVEYLRYRKEIIHLEAR